MNQLRNELDNQTVNERLSDSLVAIIQYIPLLSILVVIGFLITFFLSQSMVAGNPAWQLLAVTGVVLFVAVSHMFIIELARRMH